MSILHGGTGYQIKVFQNDHPVSQIYDIAIAFLIQPDLYSPYLKCDFLEILFLATLLRLLSLFV